MRRTALTAAMLLAAAPAEAADCTVGATPMAFGVVELLVLDATSTLELTVTCTDMAADVSVTLTANDDPSNRRMTAPGGGSLAYELFVNSGRTVPFGDGIDGEPLQGTVDAGIGHLELTVYGRIRGGQAGLRAGDYADTPSVTLAYDPGP